MGGAASNMQRVYRKNKFDKQEKLMIKQADADAKYYLRDTAIRKRTRERYRYGSTVAQKSIKRIHKFVADTKVKTDYKKAKIEREKDATALKWIASNPYNG